MVSVKNLRNVLFFLAVETCFALELTTPSSASLTTDSTSLISVRKTRYERGLDDYDEALHRRERGMMDDAHYVEHEESEKQQKAVQSDPWAGYYDFLINEGSFKFWAVFQLVTAVILVYASFAAVYYAKFNVIAPDYDEDYGEFGRSFDNHPSTSSWSGLSSQTFQRIFDALSSKKYSS